MAFDLKSLFKKTVAAETEKPEETRRKGLPLIGHLDIETQFRILGTVFLISLLITVAAIFMQGQATTRGTTYLSVAGQIAPLTQQIPKSALNAMQGQKEGFTELRDSRDNFSKLLEAWSKGVRSRASRCRPPASKRARHSTPCAKPGASRIRSSASC